MNHTEYQDEYCGMGGRKGGSGMIKSSKEMPTIFPECTKSYDVQPVGGRMQAKAREEARKRAEMSMGTALPVHDADFVTGAYNAADRGCHRVAPSWRDPRWSDATRIDTSTLYHPADRDPPNRPNFYMYRSSRIDAMDTPCRPLAVPDVHKMRYMHNDYMSHDDWY